VSAQRRFVADASHQLRTPLTGLKLRLEALGDSSPDARAATAEVDRLAQIVEELLALSRAGEAPATVTRCDLHAAARSAAGRFAAAAAKRGIVLRATPASVPAFGSCVPHELDRALDALLENAIAYASDGGEVEIAAMPSLLEVRDRGPGPPAGEEELVFERFHRGGVGSGTGLGLPIARALARGWGGDATLRARPGGGAIAALVIPDAPDREVAA
jgi:signal transduction histidine kinase